MQNTPQVQSILSSIGFNELNPMQEKALDAITQNNNVQIIAPTGSGKTFAFLLPLFLGLDKSKKGVQALVLAPTRELIIQISSVWKKMNTGVKSVTCFGGHRIETEMNELMETPSIIFGTPGRLNDHITRASIDLSPITSIVIDEFDKTLEQGFYNELAILMEAIPNLQKYVLISATTMDTLPDFIYGSDFTKVAIAEDKDATKVKVHLVKSPEKDKIKILIDLLHFIGNETAIIFVNYREAAQRVHELLVEQNIENIFYHGGLEQIDRTLALIKFMNKTVQVLVASDIAARGIDIASVGNVIHYHLPTDHEAFIHRNGRTARQGAEGAVYLIHHEEEQLQDYITENAKEMLVPFIDEEFPRPRWITLTVNAGKKNKINKTDIVGFLSKNAELDKSDIGIIDVLDTISFVAVNKNIWKDILSDIRGKKIKGKDYIFKVAK
jgi:superfamily II DNA/RNA helicase